MPARTLARFGALALAVTLAACGGSVHRATRASTTAKPPATTTSSATTTSTTTLPPTTSAPAPTVPATTAPPATAPPTTAAPAPPFVSRLVGVGNAQQVIAVAASGYGTSYATLTAWQRGASGWQQVFGPWTARVGRNGFAPPGAKR
jgi:hypothetical protein